MNAKTEIRLSAVILAGGASRRMGRDKAWVECGGRPLVQIALSTVRALGVAEIFISGRPGENYSALRCPVLLDREPGWGPLGGIERSLQAASSPLVLVLAVDLPRMTTAFLRAMSARCDRWTGVLPTLRGELEPLAAIYPKRCHAYALEALAQSRRAVRDFAGACWGDGAVRTFPVAASDALCFANWNTMAEVAAGQPGTKDLVSGG